MAQLDLPILWLSLQRAAGACDAGELALLALPDDGAREVSERIRGENGARARALAIAARR